MKEQDDDDGELRTMKLRLSKGALIVGAGDATGGAIARRFARAGYEVCVTRRFVEHLQPLVEQIRTEGGRVHPFGSDARDEQAVVTLFNHIEEQIAPLDVVVFNIGANVRFPVAEMTERVYRKVWEMGALAGFLVGREAARAMLPRGQGTIIFTGATASLREPDEAGKLMMALNIGHAAKDMSGAIDFLLAHPAVSTSGVGVVGYCMGGGLALVLASQRPDAVQAVAPYYGLIPWPDAHPDWSAITATVRGHYAANDEFFNPTAVAQLQETLVGLGKDAVLTVHPNTDHAFFNDTRPEVYAPEAAALAWSRTLEFLRAHLA